ncbi:MAG TPA: urea carboxylase-associated family protein, partial [Thermomicrobiales bacterium]|nr:urea carboxylase-associated family protein [Thermomicrobiales bacterium]
FVAFSLDDANEFLSTAVTRAATASLIPQQGMTLYSNRRRPMFEIVDDTVGRHDMLWAACDPVRYDLLGAADHANCRTALSSALQPFGATFDHLPDPINWFMYVTIKQRGELEIREPLAERNDFVVLKALMDVVVAVSACPQDLVPTNGGKPTDIMLRVYTVEGVEGRG